MDREQDPRDLTLTVIVPARNEEEGLHDTLRSLLNQTVRPDQIIVVDDASTDNTPEVLAMYPVTVLRHPTGSGSKAKAQNYALPHCTTDLVLPVDADTVLAPDYVERIKEPFANPNVVIAAGNVQTKVTKTVTERGRQIEYLFGFHYYRPIQNLAGAPVVCSGCCSAFRREQLAEAGGFPTRTIVEDMDYTWTQQIAGYDAVYVGGAEARAADPETPRFLWRQVDRWMSGFFANVRIHWLDLIKHKKMLGLWIGMAVLEILMMPVWWSTPFWMTILFGVNFKIMLLWWLGIDLLITVPVLVVAAIRRRMSVTRVLLNIPCVYFNKAINSILACKAMLMELVLVPLGCSKGLTVYKMGK